MKTPKKIKVELTQREVEYLVSLVEGQKARIQLLGKKQQELKPIKQDTETASMLEQKFVAFSA